MNNLLIALTLMGLTGCYVSGSDGKGTTEDFLVSGLCEQEAKQHTDKYSFYTCTLKVFGTTANKQFYYEGKRTEHTAQWHRDYNDCMSWFNNERAAECELQAGDQWEALKRLQAELYGPEYDVNTDSPRDLNWRDKR